MEPPVEIKQEFEFVTRQTREERVAEALTQLGGFATLTELSSAAHMEPKGVTGALRMLPARRIPGGWLLPGVAKRCPGCHQPWPDSSSELGGSVDVRDSHPAPSTPDPLSPALDQAQEKRG